MALIDGETILPLASSQDHKRIYDNDEGPNTGGMGAYSPAPVVTPTLEKIIMEQIMLPLMRGLKREGIVYKGVLYAGLMICNGMPYVLEFNCRFGDPEAQPVLMRLQSDLFDIMKATIEGRLSHMPVSWKDETSLCVVVSSRGYPGSYEKGKIITGLDALSSLEDTVVFHAGTAINSRGEYITSGGRVLGVTALGKDVSSAKSHAYLAVEKIHFEGMHVRSDIGDKAINR